MALKSDGSAVSFNRIGINTVPNKVGGLKSVTEGDGLSFALDANHKSIGWDRKDTLMSVLPNSNSGIAQVSFGTEHVLVLRTDGTVKAHGKFNFNGELDVPAGLKQCEASRGL
jgi:alpha-tubulin suppressor-like RCC1 family protein